MCCGSCKAPAVRGHLNMGLFWSCPQYIGYFGAFTDEVSDRMSLRARGEGSFTRTSPRSSHRAGGFFRYFLSPQPPTSYLCRLLRALRSLLPRTPYLHFTSQR